MVNCIQDTEKIENSSHHMDKTNNCIQDTDRIVKYINHILEIVTQYPGYR